MDAGGTGLGSVGEAEDAVRVRPIGGAGMGIRREPVAGGWAVGASAVLAMIRCESPAVAVTAVARLSATDAETTAAARRPQRVRLRGVPGHVAVVPCSMGATPSSPMPRGARTLSAHPCRWTSSPSTRSALPTVPVAPANYRRGYVDAAMSTRLSTRLSPLPISIHIADRALYSCDQIGERGGMRNRLALALLLCCGLLPVAAPHSTWAASDSRFTPPLPLAVVTDFVPPATRYGSGHRGVDLAAAAGADVRAAGAGVVIYAGRLAGRGVVSIEHPGGLRTTYEPVRASVTVGHQVLRGELIGVLDGGHAPCAPIVCLHLGARMPDHIYIDPLALFRPIRVLLKPWAPTQ